jgi:tetratricopeptide (TPR) repeat protein
MSARQTSEQSPESRRETHLEEPEEDYTLDTPRPFAPRTERAVGRTEELNAVEEALAAKEGTSLLYFIGPGGIGKTRLLEEAARLAEPFSVLVIPLIDLYHAAFHSVAGLERAIVQCLDPDGRHFLAYQEKRTDLEKRQAEGVKITQEEQESLTNLFIQEFNTLAEQGRLLLRFDTTELIQRESDRVQKLCDLATEYIEVRHWMLNVLPQLRNSVVLLAGRPPAPMRTSLERRCKERDRVTFHPFELEGLTQQAYQEYVNALSEEEPELAAIPDDVWERAWEYTAGHPIRLSLTIDLILNGRDIAQLFPPQDKSNRAVSPKEIDKYLIEELLTLPVPIRAMVRYLVLARKGLGTELLEYLEPGWSEAECADRLAEMQKFTFVKVHAGTDRIFAHDELYALFDRFMLREQRQEYMGTYQRIAKYYEDRAQEAPKNETLKTDRLYYQLQTDPWQGFWRFYVPWAEEAVRGGNSDLDMRLRDELLHFLHDTRDDPWVSERLPSHIVDSDAAVRWMRRYLTRSEHQRVMEIAERLEGSGLLLESPLYQAGADIAYAEAALYSGEKDEDWVREKLTGAIEVLEEWEEEGEDDVRKWWHTRLLGRAHNDLGYSYWKRGQSQDAIDEFKRAIWAYRKVRIHDEMAATLTNLGFVYTQLGWNVEAETTLLDAVELRKSGPALPLAYSLNTLGLFYIYADRLEQGIRHCTKALDIFKRLKQPRGAGLAHLALAFGHRKMGEEWKTALRTTEEAQEDTQEHYAKGLNHLQDARSIFDNIVIEPLRQWETYNELGSLHLDWAYVLEQEVGFEDAMEKYKQAIEYLKESVEIAKQNELTHQMADSYDDLSQAYADMGSMERSEEYVQKIQDLIPEEYRLTKEGFKDVAHPVKDWWLLLGKVHLGKAVRAIKQIVDFQEGGKDQSRPNEKDADLYEVAKQYAYAVAYFQQYSPYSAHLPRTLTSIQRRVKSMRAERIVHMYKVIQEFSRTYNVDLERLLQLFENTIGIEQGEYL